MMRTDNDPRTEHSFRVEEILHSLEQCTDVLAIQAFQERRPDKAVAVFAGQCSAEPDHQVCNVRGNLVNHPVMFKDANVEKGRTMDVPIRRVTIQSCIDSPGSEDARNAFDIFMQSVWRHGSVFYERNLSIGGIEVESFTGG